MDIIERINKKLLERKEKGNFRSLMIGQGLVDFFSNDYLGLARDPELHRVINDDYHKESTIGNGATGSRLLSGNSRFCEDLEKELASIFSGQSALLFNSGYMACQAVLSTVPARGDTIIYDEYIHACAKDGARLSQAKYFSFRHNDLADLENKIKKASGICFIMVESIYSMDGDVALLEEIIKLCRLYGALLIVDEAHSTGVYGEGGSGMVCEANLQEEVFLRIYTFGKAMGVHGACIVGANEIRDYLINFARTFIFTTALPLHSLVSIKAAFNFIAKHPEVRRRLFKNIEHYQDILNPHGIATSGGSIQTIKISGNQEVKLLATNLQNAGFDVRPILSPTVKVGEERLRICLHNFNLTSQIDRLTELLIKYK